MPRLDVFPEDHMQYAYGIYLFKSRHPLVRKLKKVAQPSVYGHRAWSSSFLLMDFLQAHPLPDGAKVLELGCGWGPAGVFCASQQQAKVTGMDIDDNVFPYMDMLAAANDCKVKSLHAGFADLTDKQLAKFDTLMGADICFWEGLTDELLALFKRARKAGVRQIILADPGRSTFARLRDECERLWPEHYQHEYWYALEPKRFEGQILRLQFAAAES